MTTIFICLCSILTGVSITTMLIAYRLMCVTKETLETSHYLMQEYLQFKSSITALKFKKHCKSMEDLANI